jgi:hypothetical protein
MVVYRQLLQMGVKPLAQSPRNALGSAHRQAVTQILKDTGKRGQKYQRQRRQHQQNNRLRGRRTRLRRH